MAKPWVFPYLFLLLCFLHSQLYPSGLHYCTHLAPDTGFLTGVLGMVMHCSQWTGSSWGVGLRQGCPSLSSELLFSAPALSESCAFSRLEGVPLESVWLDWSCLGHLGPSMLGSKDVRDQVKSARGLSRDKYPFISRVGAAYLVYWFCFQVEMKNVAVCSNPATWFITVLSSYQFDFACDTPNAFYWVSCWWKYALLSCLMPLK